MLGCLAAAALGIPGALWFFQERLIYPAPRLEADAVSLPAGVIALRDPDEPASIVGFYRGPAAGAAPRRLWLLFGGNGDLALRWDPLLGSAADTDQGFLMVEYPGYGARSGHPSPEALLAGTEATLAALAHQLGVASQELSSRVSVVGYSIGSAAALLYASKHPAQRIVLFSPFTSMLEMARRVVGSPLCHLLSHRYDNVAALRAIQAQGLPPLHILHGERDSFIPPSMGRSLAEQAPGCHFELVPGASHGDVTDLGQRRLRELLTAP